jgi:hypothetical protein
VYKLRKTLYGLKQAPRVSYGRLRGFLFSKWFEMGKVDKTLFHLKQGDDFLIIQTWMILSLMAHLTLWLCGLQRT